MNFPTRCFCLLYSIHTLFVSVFHFKLSGREQQQSNVSFFLVDVFAETVSLKLKKKTEYFPTYHLVLLLLLLVSAAFCPSLIMRWCRHWFTKMDTVLSLLPPLVRISFRTESRKINFTLRYNFGWPLAYRNLWRLPSSSNIYEMRRKLKWE